MNRKTVVVGASPKKDRYSHKAIVLLKEKGHEVVPMNPSYSEIEGIPCLPRLDAVTGPVHTVSIYLAPRHQNELGESLRSLSPERVIFNPGTENPLLKSELESAGIFCLEACTLVLLNTNQYGPPLV